MAIGSSLIVCTAGTFGLCAVAVGLATTGSSIHDAKAAGSTGGAAVAVVGNVALAFFGLAVFSAPLKYAGLPVWAERAANGLGRPNGSRICAPAGASTEGADGAGQTP
jgi:hypothetical protein